MTDPRIEAAAQWLYDWSVEDRGLDNTYFYPKRRAGVPDLSAHRSPSPNPTTEGSTSMKELRRQGDLLLIPVSTIPEGLAEVPRVHGQIVLAEGEATGHLHAIESPEATFLAADLAEIEGRFLAVEAEVDLTHPEHDTVTLPPGTYEVRRQREYADAGGITYVAD